VFLALATAGAAAQATDQPDLDRAAELYAQAESELAAGQYAEAARDYAMAFDLTKDPVLHFKIAGAHDKAGSCDLALTYYRRYLAEGNPSDEHKALTTERIVVCEKPAATPSTPDPSTGPATTTSTDPGTDPGTADAAAQLGGDPPSLAAMSPSKRRGAAWIVLGVGIALGTVGAVAAMSAEAAEKDLQDLYDIRIAGRPPEWSPALQQRYDDLVSQGDRYQKLSWIAFGAAGAAVVGAAVLFVVSAGGDHEQPPVAVHVTTGGAQVFGGWSF
jgi:tetratricopeptide (TPR) repeat protein